MSVNMHRALQRAQREKIERNIPLLIKNLNNFNKVLRLSVEMEILDENDVSELKELNVGLDEKKRRFFIKCLNKEIGLEFYMKFMTVFLRSGDLYLVNILDEDQKYNEKVDKNTHFQPQNDSTEETYIHKLKEIDKVDVKPAIKRYNGLKFEEKNFYKMESKPRGFALILVNETFDTSSWKTRKGAKKDLDLMTQLLDQMGYKIFSYYDKTKSEFEEKVKEFTSNPKLKDVDSCIVAISSHGLREGFACKDGSVYPIERLKATFNHRNCPQLRGKPKIFIIQSCRGYEDDYGAPMDSKDNKDENYGSSLGDLFEIRPCQDGFTSHLNPTYGSWLFYSVVDVFMNFACEDDLLQLIGKVHEKMDLLVAYDCAKQVPQSTVSFNGRLKKVYFNPRK